MNDLKRERYERMMRVAEEVFRYASEAGVTSSEDAVNVYRAAKGESPGTANRPQPKPPAPKPKPPAPKQEQARDRWPVESIDDDFQSFVAKAAEHLKAAGISDPDQAASWIRESFGLDDPAANAQGARDGRLERSAKWNSWQRFLGDLASRHDLSPDEMVALIDRNLSERKKPRR